MTYENSWESERVTMEFAFVGMYSGEFSSGYGEEIIDRITYSYS